MDDIYCNCCDKVEDIQKDIDEVDNYLDTIKKLKKSDIIAGNDNAINTIEEVLTEKRTLLQNNWNQAYNSLLLEADCIVEACNLDSED